MKRYKIANLIVDIDAPCERLSKLGVPYESNESGKADIEIVLSPARIMELNAQHPDLTADEIAYLATGTLFYRKAAIFDCVLLHSSCLKYKGKAYLFTADSGTGKSTHTGLWKKVFGDEVQILNDDKPVLRKMGEVWTAFGTPWSGKTDLNVNDFAPVGGIVFLKRGETNSIRRLTPPIDEVAPLFIKQISKPNKLENLEALLKSADNILTTLPLYEMCCNISEDAVWTAQKGIVPN
jgi:hypothetical protein